MNKEDLIQAIQGVEEEINQITSFEKLAALPEDDLRKIAQATAALAQVYYSIFKKGTEEDG